MAETIVANVNTLVDLKDFKFRFKKDKMGNQRANVALKLPVPSVQGVVDILTRGDQKEITLLTDSIYDVVRSAALTIVSDDEQISQDSFPFEKITWAAIANQERAERAKIEEEVWANFATEYLEIMPALTGKKPEHIALAAKVFVQKLIPLKTDKESLKKLQNQLTVFVSNTKNGEEFADIFELLNRRFDNYLKADDLAELKAAL